MECLHMRQTSPIIKIKGKIGQLKPEGGVAGSGELGQKTGEG